MVWPQSYSNAHSQVLTLSSLHDTTCKWNRGLVCSVQVSVLGNVHVAEVGSAWLFLFSSHLDFTSLLSGLCWLKESRILTTSDAHKCPKDLVYQSGMWPLLYGGKSNDEEGTSDFVHIFLITIKSISSWLNAWLGNLFSAAYCTAQPH